ncbi:hypothetical protein AB0H18_08015 [Streptomyces sp. NPDC020766]|uniref:hypothetical protein n=1 Tax=Streptomyces sp. NPDC020766 TaxID=3155011 RepID=UPI00340EB101
MDGALAFGAQVNRVRVFASGPVAGELRTRAAERSVAPIRQAGAHPTAGFLATLRPPPDPTGTGNLDVIHELLFGGAPPSWPTVIDRGAATVREGMGSRPARGEGEFDSVHGCIASHLRVDDGRFHLAAGMSLGIAATVALSNGRATEVRPGRHHFDWVRV